MTMRLWTCVLLLPLFVGCGGGEETVPGPVFVLDTGSGPTDTDLDTDPGATCTSGDLCSRSIDECGLEWTLDECDAWYADDNNCADFDSYVACNCACLDEATCDEYYGCGSFCFEDHC